MYTGPITVKNYKEYTDDYDSNFSRLSNIVKKFLNIISDIDDINNPKEDLATARINEADKLFVEASKYLEDLDDKFTVSDKKFTANDVMGILNTLTKFENDCFKTIKDSLKGCESVWMKIKKIDIYQKNVSLTTKFIKYINGTSIAIFGSITHYNNSFNRKYRQLNKIAKAIANSEREVDLSNE